MRQQCHVNTPTTTNGVPGDEAGQRTNLREQTHLVHLKEQQQCQVNKPTTTNGVPGDEAGQRTNLREETHFVHLKEQQQCQVKMECREMKQDSGPIS